MQKPISSQPSDENPVPVTHWRPMGLAEPESQPSSVETSEQAPRKKHSKSVSFSGVDTIFELRSINQDRGSHASEISSRNTPDYHAPRRRSLPPMAKDNKPRAVTNPPKMCFTSIDIPTSKVDPERTGRLRKQCRPRNNNQSRRPNSDSVKHIANHSTTGARPAQDLRMPSSPSWSSRTPLGVQEGLYSEINFTPHIRNFVLRTALLDHSNTQCVTLLDSKLDKNVFGCTSSSRLATFPTPTFKPCNVTIQPSSGKGLGMFTRATVYAGEVFFAEHPTLVVPSNPSILGTETEEVYRNMFSRLSNDVKEQLMCIFGDNFVVSSQNAGKPQPDTGAIRGSVSAHNLISRINHFPIPLSASVPNQIAKHAKDMHSYCGVFLNMCRCNHSCGPNAKWHWDQRSFSLVLTALRTIHPDEEITIAYSNVALLQHERRLSIRRSFGFVCLCNWCTLDSCRLAESDSARHFLSAFWCPRSELKANIRPSFNEWCKGTRYSTDALISEHLRALRLIEQEGLQILETTRNSRRCPELDIVRHIDAIAMCYAALQDPEKFKIWIKRGAEEREVSSHLGLSTEYQIALARWLENPKCFPVWGARKLSSQRESP